MTHNPSDEQLLNELGEAIAATDPVPDHVLAAAKGSLAWRTIDADLAELTFDSLTDELAGVRSAGGDRMLTFHAGDLEIEVAVRADRALLGQLVPPQPAAVELLSGTTSHRADAGPDGVFSFEDIPAGPVSLRVTPVGADSTVATEWLVL